MENKLDLLFFQNCLELNLCPKFLRIKLPKIPGFAKNSQQFNKKAVQIKLQKIRQEMKKTFTKLMTDKSSIRNSVSLVECTGINKLICEEVIQKTVQRHEKKLTRLWFQQRISAPNAVVNLSKEVLSIKELDAIRFGLKHHILPRNLQVMNFVLVSCAGTIYWTIK
jgi:hypothetical protein